MLKGNHSDCYRFKDSFFNIISFNWLRGRLWSLDKYFHAKASLCCRDRTHDFMEFIFLLSERATGKMFPLLKDYWVRTICLQGLQGNNFHFCAFANFPMVSCLAYVLTMMMEAKFSSEISSIFQRTIRHYILEGITIQSFFTANIDTSFQFIASIRKF
jgi:hypothetical protein